MLAIARHVVFLTLLLQFNLSYAQNTDINLLRNITTHRRPGLESTMKFFSNSTPYIISAVPVSILSTAFIQKDQTGLKKGLESGGSLVIAGALTLGLKYTVQRIRPYNKYPDIKNLATEKTWSFPSGHTSTAFATATSLTLLYPRWYVAAPAFAWAGMVAWSRMYLGVHYPSDVLGGIVIGVGSAFLSHYIVKNAWK